MQRNDSDLKKSSDGIHTPIDSSPLSSNSQSSSDSQFSNSQPSNSPPSIPFLSTEFFYTPPNDVVINNFKKKTPLVFKKDLKKIGPFPGGGRQGKGPKAGTYKTKKGKVHLAKKNKNRGEVLREFLLGNIMLGYTKMCFPSAKHTIAKTGTAFSKRHNLYVTSEKNPYYKEFHQEAAFSENQEIASERTLLSIVFPKDHFNHALKKGRFNLDQVCWHLILRKIGGDNDFHLSNGGTSDKSPILFLVKSTQAGINNKEEFEKTVSKLKETLKYLNEKCNETIEKLRIEELNNVGNKNASSITTLQNELAHSQKGIKELTELQEKYSLYPNTYIAGKYSNIHKNLTKLEIIEDERNKRNLDIFSIDYGAGLRYLTKTWILKNSTFDNIKSRLKQEPIDHISEYKEAVLTETFADWLEAPVQITDKQTDDMVIEILLEAVQRFGAKSFYIAAKEMGIPDVFETADGSRLQLTELKKSYSELLKTQKENKNHNVSEKINHPFIKVFRHYLSGRLFSRAQHCSEYSLPIRLTALFLHHERTKELGLSIKLKLTIEKYFDDIVKLLPKNEKDNFPFVDLDGDLKENLATYTQLIRTIKNDVEKEKNESPCRPIRDLFSKYEEDKKNARLNKNEIKEKIKQYFKSSSCSRMERKFLKETSENGTFLSIFFKDDIQLDIQLKYEFNALLGEVINEIDAPVTSTPIALSHEENNDEDNQDRVRDAQDSEVEASDQEDSDERESDEEDIDEDSKLAASNSHESLSDGLVSPRNENLPTNSGEPNNAAATVAPANEPIEVAPGVVLPAESASVSAKINKAFRKVYKLSASKYQNTNPLEYITKTLVDFPEVVTPSTMTMWVLSTGFVLPTFIKNTIKLATEFLPAAMETLCDHGGDKCLAYIEEENKKNKSERNNIDLAYLGYGACVTGKYMARTVRLVTMRLTSPITSIQQAYNFGKETTDNVFGKDSIAGKAVGFGLATVSGCFSVASYIGFGIVVAPVIAAVAPAVVGTKITSAVASFSSWLSSVTGPVMGWIGSHITLGLASIGIKTIGGFSVTPSVVALGAIATALLSETTLLVRSGIGFLAKKFGVTSAEAAPPTPIKRNNGKGKERILDDEPPAEPSRQWNSSTKGLMTNFNALGGNTQSSGKPKSELPTSGNSEIPTPANVEAQQEPLKTASASNPVDAPSSSALSRFGISN